MKRIVISVPKGIRYLSEWNEFKLPDFPCIIDKQIPGCGFTESCLSSLDNIILCSPRKILLENKRDQHQGETLYISSSSDEVLNIDKDLTNIHKITAPKGVGENKTDDDFITSNQSEDEDNNTYIQIRESILDYIKLRDNTKQPYKLLVTYDSFRIVKQVLLNIGIFWSFKTVVDEFQSIFIDSRFKSSTELKFVKELQGVQKVCYVSATPMIDEYLEQLDEFKDLTFYELDWKSDQPERVMKPKLTIRTTISVVTTAREIINRYKSGKFDVKYIKDESTGEVIQRESKEAVIYLNSVNNIISIIKKCELRSEEVNILCANTPDNVSRINKKLGKAFKIGKVPLKGEQHKMFTFCTRTVYLGADFYSTNARTFIISDANIEGLAVDISLDLPQIMGRQRLDNNPWKNEATFYYRSLVKSKTISKERFEEIIKEKIDTTNRVLNLQEMCMNSQKDHNILLERCEFYTKAKNYSEDYISVNTRREPDGTITKYMLANKLVLLSERRAFDIQQIDYADRFSVFSTICSASGVGDSNSEVEELFKEYKLVSTAKEKLEFLCNVRSNFLPEISETLLKNVPESNLSSYVLILGPDRCKSLGYEIRLIKRELNIKSTSADELRNEVFSEFIVGNKYSLSNIKLILKNIYDRVGYEKVPKATEMERWFSVKKVSYMEHGKKIHALEILSRLE